jgi:hypothetical protein
MPPPSKQSSKIKEKLLTTPIIVRRAAAKSRKLYSLSISLTDNEPTEYYIKWLVYIRKQLLHLDLISSE